MEAKGPLFQRAFFVIDQTTPKSKILKSKSEFPTTKSSAGSPNIADASISSTITAKTSTNTQTDVAPIRELHTKMPRQSGLYHFDSTTHLRVIDTANRNAVYSGRGIVSLRLCITVNYNN